MVDTIFWEDHYTANLDPIEKLLFLYLLTNTSTSICGIYQITLKKMAVETGIDREMVEKVLARFAESEKVFYLAGWIGIRNFIKHQNQNSPKIKRGIEIELEKAPEELKALVFGKGIDTLSHSNSNPKSNPNPKTGSRAARDGFSPLGAEVLKAFEAVDPKNKSYYGNTTQRAACDFLLTEYGLEEVLKRVGVLPRTNKEPYFPSITTPHQLKENWVKLGDRVAQMRAQQAGKKPLIV